MKTNGTTQLRFHSEGTDLNESTTIVKPVPTSWCEGMTFEIKAFNFTHYSLSAGIIYGPLETIALVNNSLLSLEFTGKISPSLLIGVISIADLCRLQALLRVSMRRRTATARVVHRLTSAGGGIRVRDRRAMMECTMLVMGSEESTTTFMPLPPLSGPRRGMMQQHVIQHSGLSSASLRYVLLGSATRAYTQLDYYDTAHLGDPSGSAPHPSGDVSFCTASRSTGSATLNITGFPLGGSKPCSFAQRDAITSFLVPYHQSTTSISLSAVS